MQSLAGKSNSSRPLKPAVPPITKAQWTIFIVLAVLTVVSWLAVQVLASAGQLKVYFLDVGQGDAIFIETPTGNQILVDGGPDNKVVSELGQVMPWFDRSLDLVVLSHAHVDHVTGLVEVLKRYRVDTILENSIPYDTAEYAEWDRLKIEATVVRAQAGQRIDLGGGVVLTVLYPYQAATATSQVKNPHDYMVVVRLDYGEDSLLLTGDMEAKVEKELIAKQAALDVDLLKVGHHGSATSTTANFLEATTPAAAFISVGARNRYGHPHPTVLDRLDRYGIKYYRTDRNGRIEVILDGENFAVHSDR